MRFTDQYAKLFQRLFPSPFAIAIILTLFSFLMAYALTSPEQPTTDNELLKLANDWYQGLWNKNLMVFAMQMMLMLVLGHVIALSKPFEKVINSIVNRIDNNAKAVFYVSFLTIIVAYFNWGLGLIFGAIFCRKIGEHSSQKKIPINYPLIGAAAYVGLMVWHGGISGSSLIKVSEKGHLKTLMESSSKKIDTSQLPDQIAFDETVFSTMNAFVFFACLIVIPVLLRQIGKNKALLNIPDLSPKSSKIKDESVHHGAEMIDHKKWIGRGVGLLFMLVVVFLVSKESDVLSFKFITPNFLNLLLFALALLSHGSLSRFLKAIDSAIGGASGILIQFPLYFGIMGIMNGSGMVNMLSDFFVSISNATTFPILTMISAGIVNIFVPSGGGQWAVQGPIIVQACLELNVPLSKAILALAYGDQLTNMLQPFWALPLLGITGLKAKEILPYTLISMLIGGVIFTLALLLF